MSQGDRVAGKSVIVTGGSSGIGEAVVAALLDQGAHVTALDREEPQRVHPMLVSVEGDVCRPESHASAVEQALDRFGRIDALVANAGVHDAGAGVDDLAPQAMAALMRRVLDVNVVGLTLAVQAAVPHLRPTGGAVVATLSDASFEAGNVGAGASYLASKTAALGLVRHFAHLYAPDVRVNAVAPGGVATGLKAVDSRGGSRQLITDDGAFANRVGALNPLGVVQTADEIAEYFLFLIGERTAGMTGQVLRPDGGLGVGLRRERNT